MFMYLLANATCMCTIPVQIACTYMHIIMCLIYDITNLYYVYNLLASMTHYTTIHRILMMLLAIKPYVFNASQRPEIQRPEMNYIRSDLHRKVYSYTLCTYIQDVQAYLWLELTLYTGLYYTHNTPWMAYQFAIGLHCDSQTHSFMHG